MKLIQIPGYLGLKDKEKAVECAAIESFLGKTMADNDISNSISCCGQTKWGPQEIYNQMFFNELLQTIKDALSWQVVRKNAEIVGF